MDSKEIKDKLEEIAKLEQEHGVLGISLNPSDSVSSEALLDYVAEVIKDDSQLIKNKSKIRRV